MADIEGSSLCNSREGSRFLTRAWSVACAGMSLDVSAVVKALFEAGAECVAVTDFHRTGWNLFAEQIDPRAHLLQGYRTGPVPGIGDPSGMQAVMFLGMHAPSGTDGFLAHTLTSRISAIEANGRLLSEVELFAASLAPFGLHPVFFSGCPTACRHASETIQGIQAYPLPKDVRHPDIRLWRKGLARAASEALHNAEPRPYCPEGPFHALITMRDGPALALKLSRRWGFSFEKNQILLEAARLEHLYRDLIRLSYLTPMTEKILPYALPLYNLWGRMGLRWARRTCRKAGFSLDRSP